MKKIGILLIIVFVMVTMVGCKKEKKVTDKSKSYICRIEIGDKENLTKKEVLVSLDSKGKVSTYLSVEDSNYENEDKFNEDCDAKTKKEEEFQAKQYENASFSKICGKDDLTVIGNYYFDLRHLTDEEKELIPDVVKYINKDYEFDGASWLRDMKLQKYECIQ